jgi:hypothetical protein
MQFNISNIVNANNYEEICDFSIIPTYGKYVTSDLLLRNSIIFCKTDFIDYLFDNIKHSKNEYILLTHHSDFPINEERWAKKPLCIKKWFAINPTVKHSDLIAIPLGLKTHKGSYLEPQYMTEWFADNINIFRQNTKQHNVYCNWNNTNTSRNDILSALKQNNIKHTHDINMPFNEYISRMSQHKFVISPPGNGIDCHRTWEALYVGCIPIVIKNSIYNNWKLPILQVNDFNDITQDLLDAYYLSDTNTDILTIKYWDNIIKHEFKT